MILVYITARNREEAEKTAKHLLENRLVGCANFFPISSMYWWEGKIVAENEHLILCKSLEEKYDEIKSEVKKIHSYKVPCITMIREEADEEYLEWLKKEVSGQKKAEQEVCENC